MCFEDHDVVFSGGSDRSGAGFLTGRGYGFGETDNLQEDDFQFLNLVLSPGYGDGLGAGRGNYFGRGNDHYVIGR